MTLYTLTSPHATTGPYSRREVHRLERLIRNDHEFLIIRRVSCVPATAAFTARLALFARRCVRVLEQPTLPASTD